MAAQQEQKVTLYHPAGHAVLVGEKRAEVLKGRGYTVSKPRAGKRAAEPKADEPDES